MKDRIKLLFKLLRHNINVWQIAGFVIANFIGGIIVLLGIQAYLDFDRFLEEENDLLSEGYVVVTKPITGITTLGNLMGVQPVFTDDEIAELQQHPAVRDVGSFSSANFRIRGSFSLGDLSISTDMFMESVPDKFLDVTFDNPDTWKADVNGTFIPVIIPRKYLNIYNYGYASTKGLPQLGEGLTTSFPVTIRITGDRNSRTYRAKIVGFTDRLNTILVPDGFLKDANMEFTGKQAEFPSRLIVATTTEGGNKSFLDFLEDNGYSIEGNIESLKLQTLVHGILWVVIGIGGIVSVLAFLLLLISILLLIEKNKDKFINLHSLGFSVNEMATPYLWLVSATDTLVWFSAALAVSLVYPSLFSFISAVSPDLKPVSLLSVWLAAGILALVFVFIHRSVILRQLKKTIFLSK